MPSPDELESRVLVLAPTGRDGALASRVIADAGIAAETCADLPHLRAEIRRGAGAVLLTEEALTPEALEDLAEIFGSQLPWSDLPLLVFSGGESKREVLPPAVQKLTDLADITLLDRPIRKMTLVSAVRAALRARRRQYEVRDLVFQLEQNVRQRDHFLAMLSHELRNPLGAILTSVQLMERRAPDACAEERKVVERQTGLLSRLVDDLLDVSRVTLGKINLNPSTVDVRDMVTRSVAEYAPAAAAREIALSLAAGADSFRVQGDPVRLEQVVSNLLTNALKYTGAGGRVEVRLSRADGVGEITVSDTGVGIEADVLPRIFDPFTQANSTIDRSQGGLGVGLTLVRSLVSLHGGTVTAESAGRGSGSSFAVRLPLIEAGDAGVGREIGARSAVPSARKRILIIEDNTDLREGLKRLLEDFGHEVLASPDGQQGVATALARRPEIVLVDIGLPKLDGYTVARRVRRALAGDVLLVALTGYGLPEDRRRAFDAGFDDHMTKPIRLDAILSLMARSEANRA